MLLSASMAHAGFLAVSHRVDGSGSDQRDLPGTFHALSATSGFGDTTGRHVWGVFGDGEMDEPESVAALTLAAREQLDNLTFVINCNLQRLDGPVRGNGQIIQELERLFQGAGWNVIKVLWGSDWDALFARDTHTRCCDSSPPQWMGSIRRWVPMMVPTTASTSSSSIRSCSTGGAHVTGGNRWSAARRARFSQTVCGVRGRARASGRTHGHSGENQERLWHGRPGRIAHDLAPAEEARSGIAASNFAIALHCH